MMNSEPELHAAKNVKAMLRAFHEHERDGAECFSDDGWCRAGDVCFEDEGGASRHV